MDPLSPKNFEEVRKNDIPVFEVLLTPNNLLYEINIVAKIVFGQLARKSVQKYENTVRLLK